MARALCIFIWSALVVHAGVELVGVSSSSDGDFFVLLDSKRNDVSGWLSVGDTFKETKIISYDKKAGLLTVTQDGEILHLNIRAPKVVSGDAREDLRSRASGKQFFSGRAGKYDTIIRVRSESKSGKRVYTCTEVWVAPEGGVRVGDEIDGSKVERKENEFPSHDILLCYCKYPLLCCILSIDDGKMWFGTFGLDDVRDLLVPKGN